MIMRNLWPVVLPTLVLLVVSETFARNPLSINEREHNVLTLSDVKGKKIKHKVRVPVSAQSVSEDLQGERIFKVNEGKEDDGRFKRDATELKDAKKSYAKLKLAQTQNDLKKWKNKDYGKYLDERTRKIDKRQTNYHDNRKSANRLKSHAKTRYQLDDKTDYYTLRKAVMEKFYARQREIEKKHAKKMSSIPKYILRHSLDKNDTNNVTSTSQVEATTDETNSVNDLVTDSDLGTSSVTTTTESVTKTTTQIDRNNFVTEVQPTDSDLATSSSVTTTKSVTETTTQIDRNNFVTEAQPTDSDLATSSSVTTTESVTETTTQIDRNNFVTKVQPTDSDLATSSVTTTESVTETTTQIDHNNFVTEQPTKNITEFLRDEDSNNISDYSHEKEEEEVIGTLKWGNKCAGRLVYNHNLKLTVHDAVSTVANLTASFSESFCITCVRAIPMNITKGNLLLDVAKNENDGANTVKVSMSGFHIDELWYITKVWATTKKEDVCEEMN